MYRLKSPLIRWKPVAQCQEPLISSALGFYPRKHLKQTKTRRKVNNQTDTSSYFYTLKKSAHAKSCRYLDDTWSRFSSGRTSAMSDFRAADSVDCWLMSLPFKMASVLVAWMNELLMPPKTIEAYTTFSAFNFNRNAALTFASEPWTKSTQTSIIRSMD